MALTSEEIQLLRIWVKDKGCTYVSNNGMHNLGVITKKLDSDKWMSPQSVQLLRKIFGNVLQSCTEVPDKAQHTLTNIMGVAAKKDKGEFFYYIVNRMCSNDCHLASLLAQPVKFGLLVGVVTTMGNICGNKGAEAVLGNLDEKAVRALAKLENANGNGKDGHFQELHAAARQRIVMKLGPAIKISKEKIRQNREKRPAF
jgi:hypothetical protein